MLDLPFRAAGGRSVLVALVLFLVSSFATFQLGPYAEIAAAAPLPEETPGMSGDGVLAALERLGEEGRARYVRFQALDLVHAALLALFAALLLAWVVKRGGGPSGVWRIVPLVPLAVLGTEAVENALLAAAASAYPDVSAASGVVGGVTAAKFGAFVLMIAALAATLVRRLRSAVRARRAGR